MSSIVILNKFFCGEWVESSELEAATGLSFKECIVNFEHKRECEWWSIAGETPEERAREGQKVDNYFRLKFSDRRYLIPD